MGSAAVSWLLIGFIAGHPIQITDLPSEQACRDMARSIAAGFGTGAQLHVECKPVGKPVKATRIWE